jgi:putative SOS response-associated peptidase YedK
MEPIHDRMPVIVRPGDRERWLSGPGGADAEALLRPYPLDDLEAYEVSTLVNSPANDREECIRALDPPLPLP